MYEWISLSCYGRCFLLTTAGTTLTDLLITPSWSNRWSGTFTNPTLGSIVLIIVIVDSCRSNNSSYNIFVLVVQTIFYVISISYEERWMRKVSPIVQKGKLAA